MKKFSPELLIILLPVQLAKTEYASVLLRDMRALIKFVDFCGKYHAPLMQYLCSALCDLKDSSGNVSSSKEEEQAAQVKMKRVLLG